MTAGLKRFARENRTLIGFWCGYVAYGAGVCAQKLGWFRGWNPTHPLANFVACCVYLVVMVLWLAWSRP